MMKKLRINTNRNWVTFISAIVFTGLLSCNSADGKKTSESKIKAPSMTIHEAAFMGNKEAIKAHIAIKTDLNEKDEYGSAPLAIAATFGKTEVAKLLIKGGVDLNVRSGDGSTPLHTSAFFCRTEIVKALLDAGADATIRNNYGSTAFESVLTPFKDVKEIYDQISRDLGPFGFKLDYKQVEATRPVIADMLKNK